MTVDTIATAEDELSALVIIEISAMIGRRRTSQAKLAQVIGKAPMWLSDRMTGRVRLTVDDLALIARGLGVGVVDLLPRGRREVTVRYPRQSTILDAPLGGGYAPVAGDVRLVTYPLGRLDRDRSPVPRQPPGRNRTAPTGMVA